MALAGNDTSHYQLTVKTYEFTKLDKNVKFSLKYSEHLVFKLFLILLTNYHIWYLLATGTPCGTHSSTPKQ